MPVLPLELLSQDQQSQFDDYTAGLRQQGDQQAFGSFTDTLRSQSLPPQNDLPQDVTPPSDVSPPPDQPTSPPDATPPSASGGPGSPPPQPAQYNASGQYGPDAQSSTPTFTQTTAGLSGGGAAAAPGLTDRARSIMANAVDTASWLGSEGQKALQAILVTEGGMNNAVGDTDRSTVGSHGPLQFYGGGGQLNTFAAQTGMTLSQAADYVKQNPDAAVQWAIGTAGAPGYLGAAIANGIRQGLSGPALATFAQRTGQVSDSPERAGANYAALFGGGGGPISGGAAQAATSTETNAGQPVGGSPQDSAPPRPQVIGNAPSNPQDQFGAFVSNLTSGAQQAGQNAIQTVGNGLTAVGDGIASVGNSASQAAQDPQAAFGAFVDTLKNGAQAGASAATQQLTGSTPAELGQAAQDLFSPDNPLTHTGQAITNAASQVPQAAQALQQSPVGQAAADVQARSPIGLAQTAYQTAGNALGGSAFWGPQADLASSAIAKQVRGETPTPEEMQALKNQAFVAGSLTGPVEGGRFYHGTGSDFARPTPDKFDPNGLFGPGYYLTDDPTVAGGVVAHGGETIPGEPGFLPGEFIPAKPARAGEVLEEGYAQQRGGDIGANVRAVDVPAGLNLLDADAPGTPQALIDRARGVVGDIPGVSANDTPEMFYHKLSQAVEARLGPGAESPGAWVNRILQSAGYDGVRYNGGQRSPMRAGDGTPIEHTALAVFPEALSKLRNATAGTVGGQIAPQFATTLGGAAAGGLGTAAATDPNDPNYWAKVGAGTVGGAGLGYGAGRLAGPLSSRALGALDEARPPNEAFAATGGADKGATIDAILGQMRLNPDEAAAFRTELTNASPTAIDRMISARQALQARGVDQGEIPNLLEQLKGGGAPQQRAAQAAREGAGEPATNPVNQKLLNMYEQPAKVDAPTMGERWQSIANWWAQNVTDDKAPLQQLQDRAAAAKGAPLTADEMAASLSRLDPNMAARVNLEQHLAPALQSVGEDRPWLSVYLTHLDNIDVAKATGQKVQAAAVDTVPETNAALRQAQATLRGRQQYLDRLTADASTPEPRIRSAQNAVNSAQRSVDAAQVKVDGIRQQGLQQAADTGAQAAANRSFSGGLTVADSQRALADMRTQLGPERMATIEQAAKQVQDVNRSLLQDKLDAGLISQDLYDALTSRYPNYVPTRITDYLKEASDTPGVIPNGKSLSVRDAGLKANTIEGTTRAREDPLASTVRNAYATQALVNRNRAFNGFVQDATLAGRMGVDIRPVPDTFTATRDQVKVSGFVNGERQTYVMPKALASMVKTEATSAIPGAAGTIWRGLMYAFKAGATSRNPLFLSANALNDAAVYSIRESSRAGGPQHLPQVLGELVKSYADAFQGATLLGEGRYGGSATQRFLLGGGGQSGIFSGTEGATRETVENLAQTGGIPILGPTDLKGAIKDILTLRPVSNIGERVELAPRVAAMRLAEQRGANPVQSVINGRNVTVDFSQGGTLSKVLNQFIPFFNAQVQGTTQIARAFNENPKAFTATVAALVGAPSLAAEAWNRGDPQRAQDYADVPSYIKDQGIVVMLPVPSGTSRTGDRKPEFFYFPLREFAPLAVLTREAAGRVLGDAPRNWDDLMGGMLKSTSPVSGGTAGDTVTSLVPLGLNTGVQLATNQDFFRNRQIVSKNADENAAPSAQALSMALEHAGVEAHPSQIEFIIRDLASGVGGAGLAGADLAVGGRTGPSQESRIQATPGVGGLVGRFVRDSTGQTGDTARQQTLTGSAKEILRAAGADLNLQPVGGSAMGVPLKGAEQTRYQQLANQYVDEAIHRAPGYPKWQQGPAQRQAIVSALVSQAREKAAAEVLRQIPAAERQQRAKGAQQQQQAGPWYYRAGEPVAVPSP